jgi:hypothetical protein
MLLATETVRLLDCCIMHMAIYSCVSSKPDLNTSHSSDSSHLLLLLLLQV